MIKSPARTNHTFVLWCAVNVSQTNGELHENRYVTTAGVHTYGWQTWRWFRGS